MAVQQRKQTRSLTQNIRLPLIGSFTNRDYTGDKDQRFINIFPETRKVESIESTKIFLNKRPGLTLYKDLDSGEGRGLIWFRNKFYFVIGNTVYEDGVSPTNVITLTGSTGPVGMLLGNSASIGDYLFICDGTGGWVVKDDGTVITISNTMLMLVSIINAGTSYETAPTVVFTGGGGTGAAATAAVEDGSLISITITNAGSGYTSAPTVSFTGGGGTGAAATAYLNSFPTEHTPTPSFIDGYVLLPWNSDVYNCVLDEPQNWDASNFLTAEQFPDRVVALARQNNQVVVLGESSIEFFYDAANVSGSPLSRNDSAIIQMGCAFPYAVYQQERTYMFVAQSESGGRAAWLVEGFSPKKISDEFIDRILDAETNPEDVRGFGFRTMGHMFYLINLPTLHKTLVYDIEEKLWHEWASTVDGDQVEFQYNYATDNHSGKMHVIHKSLGKICSIDPQSYIDAGDDVYVEITTNRYDMDTYRRKFIHNFVIVGDRYSTESNNSIDLSWTDDDYQTWSNDNVITLIDSIPRWNRLGSFRRRAFKIKHQQDNPLRLESIEIDYTEGVN